jgi:hypothetical protein
MAVFPFFAFLSLDKPKSKMAERSIEDTNRIMVKFLPELASEYAKFPMKGDKKWFTPGANQKGLKGEPCFIASTQNAGFKMDYVWGRGPCGLGYYSLLTKEAQVNLYSRINLEAPGFSCSKGARKEYDEYDDVKRLMFARYKSPKADDDLAQKAALDDSKGLDLGSYYHYK